MSLYGHILPALVVLFAWFGSTGVEGGGEREGEEKAFWELHGVVEEINGVKISRLADVKAALATLKGASLWG